MRCLTILEKSYFWVARIFPAVLTAIILFFQCIIIDIAPNLEIPDLPDRVPLPLVLPVYSVFTSATLYLFAEILRGFGKIIQLALYGKRGRRFPQCRWLLKRKGCPLGPSTIKKIKQKIKKEFSLNIISHTKRNRFTEQELKELSDVMAQIREKTQRHEALQRERTDFNFWRNFSAGLFLLSLFQLGICLLTGEGNQIFAAFLDILFFLCSLFMMDRAASAYGHQLLMAYLTIKNDQIEAESSARIEEKNLESFLSKLSISKKLIFKPNTEEKQQPPEISYDRAAEKSCSDCASLNCLTETHRDCCETCNYYIRIKGISKGYL